MDQQETVFRNRQDAGMRLAQRLKRFHDANPIVLALPRGGVVVGYEIAKQLDVSLTVMVVRKLGAPHNPELGIGAISEGGVKILDTQMIQTLEVSDSELASIIEKEQRELRRRIEIYRYSQPLPDLQMNTVILVDDGVATGVTAFAAIKAAYRLRPHRVIFAVPVCAPETAEIIKIKVDDFICISQPPELSAIGSYYEDFAQVTDDEVVELLSRKKERGV